MMPEEGSDLKTYDPKLVIVVVGGVLMSGFAEGSLVKVERNTDTYKLVIGTDGEGTRSRTNDRSGKITISLMQTSFSNAVLSGFAQLDETANAGVVPVTITDLNGASLYHADNAWVLKPPAGEHGKEAKAREWVLETDRLDWFEGGNL